jgi:MoxR-like ATPase
MTAMQNTPAALPTLADARARLQAVEDGLNAAFTERRGEVRSLTTALVAGEHVLLLGPPGTAKSALTQAFCAATGDGPFFQVLMTRYTVPEEVFGPISLAGLEHDKYERITLGYLPSAKGAFIDEIFKGNSSILNSLLTILNEGEFDNGGVRGAVPLEMCVGASNELPTDDALAALYDRFLLRHWVEPVKNRSEVKKLLMGRGAPKVTARLQPGDLSVLRAAAATIRVTDEVADLLLDLKDSLAREHGVVCSDRRWRKMVELVCARAAIRGGVETAKGDVMVLADAIWRTPDERPTVQATVAKAVSPDLGAALKVLDAATEMFGKIDKTKTGTIETQKIAQAAQELNKMANQIKNLSGFKDDVGIQDAHARVAGMRMEVAKIAAEQMGITGTF